MREDLTKCLRFISYSFRVLSVPSRPEGHVSHARSLVEDAATDDDVSPAATGINLSKWRGRFASKSALGFLAQCQMSIAICSTTLWDLLPQFLAEKVPTRRRFCVGCEGYERGPTGGQFWLLHILAINNVMSGF